MKFSNCIILLLLFISCSVFAQKAVVVDPSYNYYQNRSLESIVEEIESAGYDEVHLIYSRPETVDKLLISSFKAHKISTFLYVKMNLEETISTLPKSYSEWLMKTVGNELPQPGKTTLCINNPAYIEWKKNQINDLLSKADFDGVNLVYAKFICGKNPENGIYGCLCDFCTSKFKSMFSDAKTLPNFTNKESEDFYKKNSLLYEQWISFRTASVLSFYENLIKGKNGIKEKFPNTKINISCASSYEKDSEQKYRERFGIDAYAFINRIKPDGIYFLIDEDDIQVNKLNYNYPKKFSELVNKIRESSRIMTIGFIADAGTNIDARRSDTWLNNAQNSAQEAGISKMLVYEYNMRNDIYNAEPTVLKALFSDSQTIKLVFNKCIDSISASNINNYKLSSGRIDYVRVDGNIVLLSLSGADNIVELIISDLMDDETRRYIHDRPVCSMKRPLQVIVEKH